MINLQHFTLSKKQLDSIPENERTLIFLLCHVASELAVLTKLFRICSADVEVKQKYFKEARDAQWLTIGRLLMGKIYEFWKLLEKSFFATKISKDYAPHFDQDTNAALDNLKKYFGSNNFIKTVHHNFAFHYSADQIKVGYGKLDKDDSLDAYLSITNVNSLYSFAESVVFRSMMESISPNDHAKAITSLLDETSKVIKWINEFIGGCVATCLTLHVGGDLGAKENKIEDAEDWKTITIPYFVEIEENDS
ncbi:MAG: hypothetical protein JKY19_16225 [Alcanivoracaceae bacterium]|nr:hypothetical protein [Alcanivoracaceae bacterium]